MQSDPRQDPAQQPRDPSVNPGGRAPMQDPAKSPKDPCINPPIDPEKEAE